jgi:hypothetical protein
VIISFFKTVLEGFTGTLLIMILPFRHSSDAMLLVLYSLTYQRNLSIRISFLSDIDATDYLTTNDPLPLRGCPPKGGLILSHK